MDFHYFEWFSTHSNSRLLPVYHGIQRSSLLDLRWHAMGTHIEPLNSMEQPVHLNTMTTSRKDNCNMNPSLKLFLQELLSSKPTSQRPSNLPMDLSNKQHSRFKKEAFYTKLSHNVFPFSKVSPPFLTSSINQYGITICNLWI